jgi:hypothetical protein
MIQELLFFTFFYVYLWLVIEPHLIFHGSDRITNFPSFYRTWTFLASHLARPGGLVEYLSAFLSQLFYFSWLGAIVITMQAWAFGLLAVRLVRRMGIERLHFIAYVPALLLLMAYGQYTYFFPTTMALLCALALASVHTRLTVNRAPAIAAASFTGLSFACYYAAGAGVMLFALVCLIPELLRPGRRGLAVLYVVVAGAVPYVIGAALIGMSINDVYTDLLPISWKLLYFPARRRGIEIVYVLYLLVPGVMAVAGVTSALWSVNSGRTSIRRWLVQTLALIALAGAVAYGSFDRKQKTHFAADYYAYHEMWPEVLIEGRKGCDDPFVMHAVNRALYHTGQLGDSMFAWPQNPACLLLEGTEDQWAYWQRFAVHLDLGFINSAENALTECLAGMGDRPMILQQLAIINMVKGNLDTARVYLHALSTTLFHNNWAKHYLDHLERDPNLASDRDIQHLRSVAMAEDYPSLHLSEESMLSCLLRKNPRNRMAFEYLMASHLVNRQLTRFVKRVEELRDMGYERLPKHYEEAILVYAATARTTVQLSDFQPRDEVRQQMEHFLRTLQNYKGDKQAAFADLAKSHGDSYAFYNVYGPREKTW